MQATDLGRYLLYGKDRDFLASARSRSSTCPRSRRSRRPSGAARKRIQSETAPSEPADWRVEARRAPSRSRCPRRAARSASTARATLVLTACRRALRVRARDGLRRLPRGRDQRDRPADQAARLPFGEVRGLVDAHMHMMAFEFLGGRIHCGRPWHPFRRARRAGRLPRPRAQRRRRDRREHALLRQPARHPRHARLADAQGLAAPRLADPRADATTSGSSAPGAAACACS